MSKTALKPNPNIINVTGNKYTYSVRGDSLFVKNHPQKGIVRKAFMEITSLFSELAQIAAHNGEWERLKNKYPLGVELLKCLP